jgi:hypothetical protein
MRNNNFLGAAPLALAARVQRVAATLRVRLSAHTFAVALRPLGTAALRQPSASLAQKKTRLRRVFFQDLLPNYTSCDKLASSNCNLV